MRLRKNGAQTRTIVSASEFQHNNPESDAALTAVRLTAHGTLRIIHDRDRPRQGSIGDFMLTIKSTTVPACLAIALVMAVRVQGQSREKPETAEMGHSVAATGILNVRKFGRLL